jgi:hypothetical protein
MPGLGSILKMSSSGQALRETPEHLLVDDLAGVLDGAPGVISQGRGGPLAPGYADDRAVEHPAAFQAVQGSEGHFLRQVSGNAEDHQDIRGRVWRCSHGTPLSWPWGVGVRAG